MQRASNSFSHPVCIATSFGRSNSNNNNDHDDLNFQTIDQRDTKNSSFFRSAIDTACSTACKTTSSTSSSSKNKNKNTSISMNLLLQSSTTCKAKEVPPPVPFGSDFVPTVHHVVCGRGKKSYGHPGNQRFLQVVASHIHEYSLATTKQAKSDIVQRVVDEIETPGGGFIRQDPVTGVYFKAEDGAGREKTSQALRDCLKHKYKSSKDIKRKNRKEKRLVRQAIQKQTKQHSNKKQQLQHRLYTQSSSAAAEVSDLLQMKIQIPSFLRQQQPLLQQYQPGPSGCNVWQEQSSTVPSLQSLIQIPLPPMVNNGLLPPRVISSTSSSSSISSSMAESQHEHQPTLPAQFLVDMDPFSNVAQAGPTPQPLMAAAATTTLATTTTTEPTQLSSSSMMIMTHHHHQPLPLPLSQPIQTPLDDLEPLPVSAEEVNALEDIEPLEMIFF